MIYELPDVRRGFSRECDVVVVGSGPGGAVAAANLARAGMRVIVLEAGPRVREQDMTRDAPRFLARYFWEGGMRVIGGSTLSPSLAGRCLGGGSVSNSAIMLRLPTWTRKLWAAETGIDLFTKPELEAAYDRIYQQLHVTETPMAVMGRRNLVVRDAMSTIAAKSMALPRAVKDCQGCGDCLTGCVGGHKQSVDRNFLPAAEKDGAEIYTCCHVDTVRVRAGRAVGVEGHVVDPRGRKQLAPFRVRAKFVVLAAGALHTPVILLKSGVHANHTVGATLQAHIGGGMVGIMDEVVDPWIGASQGWGAFSDTVQGMKFECLWAAPSAIMVRWGDIGRPFVERLHEVKHATLLAMVYRGDVRGHVRVKKNGMPSARVYIPEHEARVVYRGLKTGADSLLAVGARYVHTGIHGVVDEMRSPSDTATLLGSHVKAKHLQMTMNHVFGSCRMSNNPNQGTVDETGQVRDVAGLYLADGSIFPSASAVNPQATIMALSDLITRRLGNLTA